MDDVVIEGRAVLRQDGATKGRVVPEVEAG